MKRSRTVALLSVVAGVLLFGSCGGGNQPKFNPTPTVTTLFPSVITAGSDGFVMSVNGTGFISGSTGATIVNWNGSPRSTTFNTTTGELAVEILQGDVANPTSVTITATNPAPGGGTSATGPTFTIEPVHPGLNLISLNPSSAAAGGDAFMLTVNAIDDGIHPPTNFVVGDIINWNGTQLITTVTPPNQATAQITRDMIHTAGAASVNVSTTDPAVATVSTTFTISGPAKATPAVSSLAPSSAIHGSADFEMRITGSGFAPNASVEFRGHPVATSFISPSQLIVLIPAAEVEFIGDVDVTVTNPAPGGGMSLRAAFKIE